MLLLQLKTRMLKIVLNNMVLLLTHQENIVLSGRPYHYIGLELAYSIYSIALQKEPTGCTKFYKADVATIAKKLMKGEILDGEGGFTVRGEGVAAEFSKKNNILPLGLSDGLIVKKDIEKNELITLDMVN